LIHDLARVFTLARMMQNTPPPRILDPSDFAAQWELLSGRDKWGLFKAGIRARAQTDVHCAALVAGYAVWMLRKRGPRILVTEVAVLTALVVTFTILRGSEGAGAALNYGGTYGVAAALAITALVFARLVPAYRRNRQVVAGTSRTRGVNGFPV
jgi:hypothetical protein